MILLDTSGIIAALFEDQRHHEECAQVLREDKGPLLLSPFVFAEVAALIRRHGTVEAALMFIEDVERGAYELVPFAQREVAAARAAIARHKIGLGTASLLVLADRHDCRRVLSLRRASFPKRFRVLPS